MVGEMIAERRWDEAAARLEELLQVHHTDRRAYNLLARVLLVRGRLKATLRTCSRWQQVLEEEGRFALASEVSRAILRLDPHSVEARTALLRHMEAQGDKAGYLSLARREARFFMEVGQGEISLDVLQRALEQFPGDIDLAVDLADMCVAQGHLQEAVMHFRRLAATFEAAGDHPRACDAYRRLKLLLPEAPDVALQLARSFMARSLHEEASAEFRAVLRLNLDDREALLGLGQASHHLGAHRDATLAFRKLLAVDSRDPEARFWLGQVLASQGQVEEAVRELLGAGMFWAELREFSLAREAYQRALALAPEHPTALRELSNLVAAEAEPGGVAAPRRPVRPPDGGRTSSGESEALVAAPPPPPAAQSLSEEELYAAAPYAEGGDTLLEGAAQAGEEGALGGGEAGEAPASVPVAVRVQTVLAPGPGLTRPSPVLFLSHPHHFERIQAEVQGPPDPGQVPWAVLPDLALDGGAGSGPVSPRAGATEEPAVSALGGEGGRVQSAFGSSGGFREAMFAGAAGRARKASTAGSSASRSQRSQVAGPPEPAIPLTLAERIARARKASLGGDG